MPLQLLIRPLGETPAPPYFQKREYEHNTTRSWGSGGNEEELDTISKHVQPVTWALASLSEEVQFGWSWLRTTTLLHFPHSKYRCAQS